MHQRDNIYTALLNNAMHIVVVKLLKKHARTHKRRAPQKQLVPVCVAIIAVGEGGHLKWDWVLASSSSHEDISYPNLCDKLPSALNPPTTLHYTSQYSAGMWNSGMKAGCNVTSFSKTKAMGPRTIKPNTLQVQN